MKFNSFNQVKADTNLIYNFESYIHSNDPDIFMKGESSYLDMKESLMELDSTSVQIQGGLDILDSYFEEIALLQFEKEKNILYHHLIVEFSDHFNGKDGKTRSLAEKDKDIIKALELLNDSVAYENIFVPQ